MYTFYQISNLVKSVIGRWTQYKWISHTPNVSGGLLTYTSPWTDSWHMYITLANMQKRSVKSLSTKFSHAHLICPSPIKQCATTFKAKKGLGLFKTDLECQEDFPLTRNTKQREYHVKRIYQHYISVIKKHTGFCCPLQFLTHE